jgi:hypothetical protein
MCEDGDFITTALKRREPEHIKCHAKTMMSITADKTLKKIPTMCRSGRTWRKENEGRS